MVSYSTRPVDGGAALVAELRRRNSILYWTALGQAALLAVFLTGIALDPRTVGGESVWLKPAKFAGALALVAASVGWIGEHLPAPDRTLRRASGGIGAVAVGEIALIGGQAARGVDSHFNTATTADTLVYLAMGLLVTVVVALVAWVLARSWRGPFAVAPAYAWGIRLGLLAFVLGSLEGWVIVAAGASAVGAGPAVPVLGWNLGGDLRIAHFLGLHALQVLPLSGYLAAVAARRGRIDRPLAVVGVVAAVHGTLMVATFAHAVLAVVG